MEADSGKRVSGIEFKFTRGTEGLRDEGTKGLSDEGTGRLGDRGTNLGGNLGAGGIRVGNAELSFGPDPQFLIRSRSCYCRFADDTSRTPAYDPIEDRVQVQEANAREVEWRL